MSEVIKRGPGRPPMRDTETVRAEPEIREADIRDVPRRVRKRSGDKYHIPNEMIPAGMDYQWVVDTILGQPAPHDRQEYEINGWRPVPASRHPGMWMPKDYKGEINVGGLVLCERPIELTIEAREEDQLAARQARYSHERKLMTGQIDGVSLDTAHPSARANSGIRKEFVAGSMPVPD